MEKRKCTFRVGMGRSTDEQKTGLFHQWGTTAYENRDGQQFVSETIAVVECEDGKIYTPFPASVQFIEELNSGVRWLIDRMRIEQRDHRIDVIKKTVRDYKHSLDTLGEIIAEKCGEIGRLKGGEEGLVKWIADKEAEIDRLHRRLETWLEISKSDDELRERLERDLAEAKGAHNDNG